MKAGSGAATFGTPDSPGVTAGDRARHRDGAATTTSKRRTRLFAPTPARIAAVIVEPVVGNMGVVAAAAGFLAGLRDALHRGTARC